MTFTNNNKINSSHATNCHFGEQKKTKKQTLNGLASPVSTPHVRMRASYPFTVRLGF
jgi:hypothetical protein